MILCFKITVKNIIILLTFIYPTNLEVQVNHVRPSIRNSMCISRRMTLLLSSQFGRNDMTSKLISPRIRIWESWKILIMMMILRSLTRSRLIPYPAWNWATKCLRLPPMNNNLSTRKSLRRRLWRNGSWILYPNLKSKSPKNRRFSKKKKRGSSRSKDRRKENMMILKGERKNWLSTNKSKEESKNRRTKIIAATPEKEPTR